MKWHASTCIVAECSCRARELLVLTLVCNPAERFRGEASRQVTWSAHETTLQRGTSAGVEAEASGRGYLAQHPLFEQIPELRADLVEPEYCALGEGELQSVNAWFGPPGTVLSPAFVHPGTIFLTQITRSRERWWDYGESSTHDLLHINSFAYES